MDMDMDMDMDKDMDMDMDMDMDISLLLTWEMLAVWNRSAGAGWLPEERGAFEIYSFLYLNTPLYEQIIIATQ